MARFGRVITAMVTPFADNGDLQLDSAANLAQWLVETGSEGLVVGGTTGEAPTLSDAEIIALAKAVCEAVTVPVLVGVGTNDTRHAVELTRRVNTVGADGILCVTPYYNRPSQAGIAGHFRAIAAVSELPMLLYDIPIRAGRKIDEATILELADGVEQIVGLKDATGAIAASARLIAEAPDDFELYSGNDGDTLPLLALGAVGVIAVASHWAGRQFVEMIDAFQAGDIVDAQRKNAKMLASYRFAGTDAAPNPIPTKALLRVLGLDVGECRAPMGPTPAGLEDEARRVLAGLR